LYNTQSEEENLRLDQPRCTWNTRWR